MKKTDKPETGKEAIPDQLPAQEPGDAASRPEIQDKPKDLQAGSSVDSLTRALRVVVRLVKNHGAGVVGFALMTLGTLLHLSDLSEEWRKIYAAIPAVAGLVLVVRELGKKERIGDTLRGVLVASVMLALYLLFRLYDSPRPSPETILLDAGVGDVGASEASVGDGGTSTKKSTDIGAPSSPGSGSLGGEVRPSGVDALAKPLRGTY